MRKFVHSSWMTSRTISKKLSVWPNQTRKLFLALMVVHAHYRRQLIGGCLINQNGLNLPKISINVREFVNTA